MPDESPVELRFREFGKSVERPRRPVVSQVVVAKTTQSVKNSATRRKRQRTLLNRVLKTCDQVVELQEASP